ncbi:MAG TPA: S8 family serine peptidase [Arthrobacter sp.]|nr:S8 family serine peptidase [Arthrobacter sp.]
MALGIAGLAGTAAAEPEQSERQSTAGQPVDTSGFVDGATYIVTLAEDPATMYDGGVSGIASTAPDEGEPFKADSDAVKEYQKHLLEHHKETAAKVEAEPTSHYTLTMNGFAAELSAMQAKKLAVQKNVIGVEKSQLHKVQQSSTDFLGMGSDRDGSGGVWQAVGGTGEAGSGIVIGVIDTGIAPENPSFAGEELESEESASTPYLDDGDIIYHKADGGTFTGACQTGAQFMPDDCNTKLISAKYFVEGFGPANVGTPETDGEYGSPRDGNGHGSHVAGVAAGNFGVEVAHGEKDTETISGVAPAAKIAAYKACWTGNEVGTTKDNGCATSDLLAAIEAATADGVDVINYSIGGVPAEDTISAIDRAFLGAVNAGIFVAAAAPNPEAGSSTAASASAAPWITSVGTGTYETPQSTVVLGDGTELTGASTTVSEEGLESAPLILADDAARAESTEAQVCAPGSLDPEQVKGKIVVCDRGGDIELTAKATEVADAGGAGMVLLNTPDGHDDLQAVEYTLPTVHLDASHRKTVRSYAQEEDATASMIPEAIDPMELPAPQLPPSTAAGPASDADPATGEDAAMGGETATGEDVATDEDGEDIQSAGQNVLAGEAITRSIITPDVIAPGTHVLAAGANAQDEDPVQTTMSGTSTAAPHVAGLAAVYLGEHPNAAPAEIKSALMTTAYNAVDGEGKAVTDVLAQGAGHVDPGSYLNPGMYFPAGTDQWAGHLEALGYDAGTDVAAVEHSGLNLPSIAITDITGSTTVERTVVSTGKGTYTPSVKMPGFDVSVSPSTLKFNKAGQKKTFEVTIEPAEAAGAGVSGGYLTWTSKGGETLRMPLAVATASLAAPDRVSGQGISGALKMKVTPRAGSDGKTGINTMGLAQGDAFDPDQGRFIGGFLGEPVGGDPVRSLGHSGSGQTGQTISYKTEVPRGTQLAKFDLDAVDDEADLDLVVVELDADGVPVDLWQSASDAADESVTISEPHTTAYLVQVNIHSAEEESKTAEFDLTSFVVQDEATEDALTASPESISTKQGESQRIKLSWKDLDDNSVYIGLVSYGDTLADTLVRVTTGESAKPE